MSDPADKSVGRLGVDMYGPDSGSLDCDICYLQLHGPLVSSQGTFPLCVHRRLLYSKQITSLVCGELGWAVAVAAAFSVVATAAPMYEVRHLANCISHVRISVVTSCKCFIWFRRSTGSLVLWLHSISRNAFTYSFAPILGR